jgi:hypothetical protein
MWTHIPNTARVELRNSYETWHAAYVKTLGPHIKADTTTKNQAKKASIKLIRKFINLYLRYEPVTDADRDNMGIRNKKENYDPVPDPADQVSDVEFCIAKLPRSRFAASTAFGIHAETAPPL